MIRKKVTMEDLFRQEMKELDERVARLVLECPDTRLQRFEELKKNPLEWMEHYWPAVQKLTKTTWWEKAVLWFVRPEIEISGNVRTVSKTFRGKKYVLSSFIMPPNSWNCRHEFTFKTAKNVTV